MLTLHALRLHAISLLVTPRAYLAAWQKFRAHGTQTERWSASESFDVAWDERTAMMAAMVPAGSSVLEFGSGREQLARYLPEGCSYQPSDLVARSQRTLVCNLNEGFPALVQSYDSIIFSGVIEYIHDLPKLFRAVRKHTRQCIVSYAPTDQLRCMATRLSSGWVNHFSEAMLVNIMTQAGFTVAERQRWNSQVIFRLT